MVKNRNGEPHRRALPHFSDVSLALLTDFYELTMMGGYLKESKQREIATFELFFRRVPEGGGYCIAAGLEAIVDYILNLRFDESDLRYLRAFKIFDEAFLRYLKEFRFTGDLWSVPEGTVVFPEESVLQVKAPIGEAQLIESALLNLFNFQTLIATKAARVVIAAKKRMILEFGLRRAHGIDGALSASRAAFVGGVHATSNVLAGKYFGIPVVGTHAHSWVMSFSSELEAFRAFAHAFPDRCVLLVDTYDTLRSGVPNAIRVARELKRRKKRLLGIRLDSGDLTFLSREARAMLDQAGFPDVKIVASNDLDEYLIKDLIEQGARIDTFGVGTRLITAKGEPALGGVYKLVSLFKGGKEVPRIKISQNVEKTTNPGSKVLYRFYDGRGQMLADGIFLRTEKSIRSRGSVRLIHPYYDFKTSRFAYASAEPLLESVIVEGRLVKDLPGLRDVQDRTYEQLKSLPPEYQRLYNPHIYKVGLSEKLSVLKRKFLLKGRR